MTWYLSVAMYGHFTAFSWVVSICEQVVMDGSHMSLKLWWQALDCPESSCLFKGSCLEHGSTLLSWLVPSFYQNSPHQHSHHKPSLSYLIRKYNLDITTAPLLVCLVIASLSLASVTGLLMPADRWTRVWGQEQWHEWSLCTWHLKGSWLIKWRDSQS